MSLKRKIAHNAIIQLSGKIISTLLGLAAVFIMTRTLGAEKFGWYTTAIGFLQFIGIFSDFGFIITTANMLSEPKFEQKKLLDTLFTWRLITALIFNGLSPFIFLLLPYPSEIKIAVAVVAVSFLAISISNVFIGYYQKELKTHIITTGELLARTILVIGTALLAIFKPEFLPIMILISVAAIANAFYLYIKMPRISFSLDKQISKAIFQKIWPTALCIIFNSFYLQGDRVILPLYTPAIEVGFYGAAYRVLDIIVQMSALVMGIMAPLIAYAYSRNLKEEFKSRLQMSFDLIALFLIPMMLGAIALAKPIMTFVGSTEFANAGNVLIWLSWAILGICMGMVFGYTALAINKQKQAIWIYAIDAFLSIIGYFIFIPRFGIYGAAGVTIFSELFAGIMLMLLVAKYTNFLPSALTLLKIFASSLVMYFILMNMTFPHVLITIFFGGLIYTICIFSLKTISKETLKEVFKFQNI